MARAKVLGTTVIAPAHWDVEPAANGGRQVRVVAAVTSKRAFLDLLNAAGVNLTMYGLNYAGADETGNDVEVTMAMSEPGAIFHATSADGWTCRTYVKAADR